mmetsp:Transcript_14363/g.40924  ORF Transcript_14363/g.40924 Transcript_14363/m.40924 type:complete len:524 (+) Transcript_14363:109-1680(+)
MEKGNTIELCTMGVCPEVRDDPPRSKFEAMRPTKVDLRRLPRSTSTLHDDYIVAEDRAAESWTLQRGFSSELSPKCRKRVNAWIGVKLQADSVKPHPSRGRLRRFVESPVFTVVTTSLICINAVMMGVEAEHGDDGAFWTAVEIVFMAFYTVELGLRVVAHGSRQLRNDGWIRFDALVLLIAYADVLIMGPILANTKQAKQVAMILRMARLLKLTRLLRLLHFFRELWLLCSSFMSAFKTLSWTFLLLILVIYVFSILFVKMLEENTDENINEWFGDIGSSMFTLFQIMTLEDWVDIPRVMWTTDQWFLVFLILIFIFISSFAIMNTVLAVIVEHTLTEALNQREDVLRKAQNELERAAVDLLHIFQVADENQNGKLTKEEFVKALANKRTRQRLQELGLGEEFSLLDPEEIGVLFDTIDVDDSTVLTPQEFVDGIIQMRGVARARHVFEMQCTFRKEQRILRKTVRNLQEQVCCLQAKFLEETRAQERRILAFADRCESEFSAMSRHLTTITSALGLDETKL